MLASELLDMMRAYLERKASLEDLEDWLAPRLPLLFKMPSCTDADLAATIELAMAEMSSGLRTEDEFRALVADELKSLVNIWVTYPEGKAFTCTESSNVSAPVFQEDYAEPIFQPSRP